MKHDEMQTLTVNIAVMDFESDTHIIGLRKRVERYFCNVELLWDRNHENKEA